MPSEKLKPYIDSAVNTAKISLRKTGALAPMFVLINTTSNRFTLVADMGHISKEHWGTILNSSIQQEGADAVVMLAEAFIKVAAKPSTDAEFFQSDEWKNMQRKGLRNDPEAFDAMVVQWKAAWGESGHITRRILKVPHSKRARMLGELISNHTQLDAVFDLLFVNPSTLH